MYGLVAFFGLIVPLTLAVIAIFEIRSDLKGAPFVPTDKKIIDSILRRAKLKKNQLFIEFGSGDGRVVRMAVEKYGVRGLGIELNPLLVIYSRLLARRQNLKNIKFQTGDFFKADTKPADVVFLFLLPKTLVKLKKRLEDNCKKGVLVISHGFKIDGFDKYLVERINRKIFPTYFYKLW